MKLKYLILYSILIREAFSFWTGHPYDFEMFARVGEQLARGEPLYVFIYPYEDISFWPHGYVGYAYPPLFAYYCMISYLIYKFIGLNLPFLYYFLLKQPMIIGDVACGYLIYKINVKFFNNSTKPLVAWLFNPITIIFSSIWGIPHALAISFVLLYLLKYELKYSFIFIFLAFLIIGLPFIYIISLIILFLNNKKHIMTSLFIFLLIGIVFPLVTLIPFKLQDQIGNIYLAVVDVLFKKSLGQFNAYMIFNYLYYLNPYIFSDLLILASNTLPYIWLPILIISLALLRHSIKKINYISIANIFLLATLIFLIFRETVNEQYILYFISMYLASYKFIKNDSLKKLFLIIQINTFMFMFINNPFFLRFITPLNQFYYMFDISLTTTEPFKFVRLTIMTIAGTLNTILLIFYLKKFIKLIYGGTGGAGDKPLE
jgi:hypothetical protein